MNTPENAHCAGRPVQLRIESRVRYDHEGNPSNPYPGLVATCAAHPDAWAKPLA
jgi:hypothetical protein